MFYEVHSGNAHRGAFLRNNNLCWVCGGVTPPSS